AVEVSLRAGAAPPPVTLQLRERPGIRGRVVFPPGEEMDAMVFAQRWDSASPPDYQQLLAVGSGQSARRSKGFRFFFRDLLPGRYVVAASRVEGRVESVDYVDVGDRLHSKDAVLPPLDAVDYIVLWVRGPGGETLADIDISSGCTNGNSTASGSTQWARRPDGSSWALHYTDGFCGKRTPDLRYTLDVDSRRF